MNERIEKLAEESYNEFYNIHIDLEKFVELIIQECAQIARATPAPDFDDLVKDQLGHTWDMAAIEAGREIIKHFGVE
jgi:hypothetical protein